MVLSFFSGPYAWTICICNSRQDNLIIVKRNLAKNLTNLKANFNRLKHGKTFKVCAQISVSLCDNCNLICSRSEKCQEVRTLCEPLSAPTKPLKPINWSNSLDGFNPFSEIKFEMEKETFNGGGLNKFIIR